MCIRVSSKTVSLRNCIFTGNRNLEAIAEHAGGGAVAIECSQDNVKAVISGCTFTDNSCTVENRGRDVWMCSRFVKDNSDEIEKEVSGCTLEISGCNIDLSSNSVSKTNIN